MNGGDDAGALIADQDRHTVGDPNPQGDAPLPGDEGVTLLRSRHLVGDFIAGHDPDTGAMDLTQGVKRHLSARSVPQDPDGVRPADGEPVYESRNVA